MSAAAVTRAQLDQLAGRLMLEYREAGEPPYKLLTDSMGVSKSTVSRLLNGTGRTLPRWWKVEALLTACEVQAATIEEIKRVWIAIRNVQKPIFLDTEAIWSD
ncbi:helix-turn-helix domain-containing protein [Micromonospora sp. NPDC049203]|uniref:helix-turn-helix domain-containing protein n=1 Tax=Micromonospora sp. NPDC049203 TaxID=3364267 RepID=UPI003711604C